MNGERVFTQEKPKEILSFTLQNQYKRTETAEKIFAALARTLFDINNNGIAISVINSRIKSNYVNKAYFFSIVNAFEYFRKKDYVVIDIANFIEAIQKPIKKFYQEKIEKLEIQIESQKRIIRAQNSPAVFKQKVDKLTAYLAAQEPESESQSCSHLSLTTVSALSLIVGISLPAIVIPSAKRLLSMYLTKAN